MYKVSLKLDKFFLKYEGGVKLIEDIKDNCFIKMSMHLFSIFNDSLKTALILLLYRNAQIQTPCFAKKHWFLKTVKTFYPLSKSLLYLWKYFINQNKNYIFMIKKDLSFYNKNLQSPAVLHKKLKIFNFFFSALVLPFSKIFSVLIFLYYIFVNVSKISTMNKKSYFSFTKKAPS